MIVCPEYRTCFFAIPRTASKAISKALTDHLGGVEIKPMHLCYEEFMREAGEDVRTYFTFATVRNPFDSVVSAYFKKKSDHNGRFSRGTFRSGRPIAARAMEEYRFIRDNDADFATYFEHFYTGEYAVPRHEDTIAKVDRVLRYENLAEEYAHLITERGWPPHELPKVNQTAGKAKGFTDYYPERIRPQANRVFARVLQAWGYPPLPVAGS